VPADDDDDGDSSFTTFLFPFLLAIARLFSSLIRTTELADHPSVVDCTYVNMSDRLAMARAARCVRHSSREHLAWQQPPTLIYYIIRTGDIAAPTWRQPRRRERPVRPGRRWWFAGASSRVRGATRALFVRLTGAPAGSETMRHRSGCRECATERRTCLVRPACRRNVPHETDFWNSLPADAVDFIYRYLSFVDRF